MKSLPGATTTSPYAPSGTQQLRHSSSTIATATAAASVAFVIFVVRFWTARINIGSSSSSSDEDKNKLNLNMKRLWECLVDSGPGRAILDRLRDSRASARFRSILRPLGAMPISAGFGGTVDIEPNGHEISSSNNNNNNNDDIRREIRNHRAAIQSVLNYWFGQYTPEKSQKMLWMIGASSKEHRRNVDAEITSRFEGLLKDLSSPSSDTHRNGSGDMENSSFMFMSGLWKEWCLDTDGIYGAHGKIAAIIVLDQFSRHILRHHETNSANNGASQQQSSLPTKESLDAMALVTAELLVKNHEAELECGMIPLPMRVFALMPYRHASTMESVEYVQKITEEMAALEEQTEAMVGRFRKATNRRLAILQDEQRRKGTSTFASASIQSGTPRSTGASDSDSDNDIDSTSGTEAITHTSQNYKQFSDDDILETFPFEADMTPSLQHPIHKTMVRFLAEQGIHPSKGKTAMSSSPPKAGIIVSLSGGVDSMVLAACLAHLKASCGYDHLTILAVHIDYANRPESGAEAAYVRRYCEEHLHGHIEFSCRTIGEVTRGITARDDYERIAREIRYESYRSAVARAHKTMGLVSRDDRRKNVVGVVLGHHRGDLRENVLSNAHKGCGPLDLSGMTTVSKNDGITLYRPLLPLEKSFVFDYAHLFGVPYYKDTTPHWSTRGKLRNKLLPLLEEIYGDGSMNNLSNLAVESDECRALMNKSMIEPFLKTIIRKPLGIIFGTASWKEQPLFFWKVVLREALHSVGLGMFSDKSVTAFLERIRAKKVKAAWLQCRKDYGVYLQDDGRVLVLYPASFPWSKKDSYGLDGNVLDFDTDKMVGPWVVRTEVVPDLVAKDESSSLLPETWLAKKAVLSMETFMDGEVEYFVEAPTFWDEATKRFLPRPLVFRRFSKSDRPRAWKNCDLRIQSTLPVLGIGDSLVDGNTNNPEYLIRISMTLGGIDVNE